MEESTTKSFDAFTDKHSISNYVKILETLSKTKIHERVSQDKINEILPHTGEVWHKQALKYLEYTQELIDKLPQATNHDILAPDAKKVTDNMLKNKMRELLREGVHIKEEQKPIEQPQIQSKTEPKKEIIYEQTTEEDKQYITESLLCQGNLIKIILKNKNYEISYEDNIINKYEYTGKITNSMLVHLAGLFTNLTFFEKQKDAKKWIFDNGIFKILTDARKKLDERIKQTREHKIQQISPDADFIKNATVIRVSNFIDNVKLFHQRQPFFYDATGNFWFWIPTEHRWKIVDETDLMNSIDRQLVLGGETVGGAIKNSYLESFKRVGRLNHPKEPEKSWIQFKSQIFDYKTKTFMPVTPEYFFCNPIPHNIGTNENTPTVDKLFTEWVGTENMQTLYEIIAYCCIIDYPIHTLFSFIGTGRNGKSTYIRFLTSFIGVSNSCSTELDMLLDSKFESAKLYKKLVCTLGETNFGVINKTSLLKKLTGQDLIGYEFKGKQPFDDYNYAKILICSNSLPTSEDTSEGFYRRWIIIDFPNNFPEGKNILLNIPEEEYSNLACKICRIIPELLENGKFTNQGTIEERKQRYVLASNPLPFFIEKYCVKDLETYIPYSTLYTTYCNFLKINDKRIVSRKEFSNALLSEGIENKKTSREIQGHWVSGNFIEGIKLDVDACKKMAKIDKNMTDMTDMTEVPISSLYRASDLTLGHIEHNENVKAVDVVLEKDNLDFRWKRSSNDKKKAEILRNCYVCGLEPCIEFVKEGPICEFCYKKYENMQKNEDF